MTARMASTSSETVTYSRGSLTDATVTAVVGMFIFRILDAYGNLQRIHSRDFLIKQTEITAFGEPAAGDEILETGGDGVVRKYRVIAPDGEDEWQWSDEYHNTYRIHTKYIQDV